jgi:2-polyprenyl-6-methoxyphenol hydroxylase-like FAD-dependent oxidoreductase
MQVRGQNETRTAIICGGGIAGLAAAIALARHGWSVDVYERDTTVREIGAGIFIKGNAQRVLRDFGVADRILSDGIVLREARTLDQNGALLQRRLLRGATVIWNAKREHVVRALYERARALGARVHTGAKIESVDTDGSVHIHGQSLSADLVIAADGVHSLARHALGLDRPVKGSRSGAIRLLVPRTEHDADDFVREFWSGDLRIGLCPCSPHDLFGYFIAPLDDERGTRVPIDLDYWSARFPALAAEGYFVRAYAAETVHHPYPLVRSRSWVKGSVVLMRCGPCAPADAGTRRGAFADERLAARGLRLVQHKAQRGLGRQAARLALDFRSHAAVVATL